MLLLLPVSGVASQGLGCDSFVYEKDDLGVCSETDSASIFNTTSGDLLVELDARLETVSYTSLIFTFGVVHAVRLPIGIDCWSSVPEQVALSLVNDPESFSEDAVCRSHPTNSPSLGWETRFEMDSTGYAKCSDIIDIHEDHLRGCVRFHADRRAFATFGYMMGILAGFVVLAVVCVFFCGCFVDF